MENGVILTWSLENIVTVVAMAAVGYLLFGLIAQFVRQGGVGPQLRTIIGQTNGVGG